MAKTYETVKWQNGQLVSAPYVEIDGVRYEVHMPVYKGATPISPSNLNHMDNAIKELYEEGTTSKDIVIGDESEITEDTKIFIGSGEIENVGSEVVDTLENNESYKAPSVRAINIALGQKVSIKRLWSNPNPAESFTAQNITLSSADYDYLLINFQSNLGSYCKSEMIKKGQSTQLVYTVYDNTIYFYQRNFTYVSDTSYAVGSGNLNGQERNWLAIPVEIFGIKLNSDEVIS